MTMPVSDYAPQIPDPEVTAKLMMASMDKVSEAAIASIRDIAAAHQKEAANMHDCLARFEAGFKTFETEIQRFVGEAKAEIAETARRCTRLHKMAREAMQQFRDDTDPPPPAWPPMEEPTPDMLKKPRRVVDNTGDYLPEDSTLRSCTGGFAPAFLTRPPDPPEGTAVLRMRLRNSSGIIQQVIYSMVAALGFVALLSFGFAALAQP